MLFADTSKPYADYLIPNMEIFCDPLKNTTLTLRES